ncbi:MAG TPA: M20/M25/M40 family metallo-hydrolase [Thermoleophilaceae bacterium]|nr:M20/M25/M40 family metallo-hydrolase [Thermoleophilaceae bacterium]
MDPWVEQGAARIARAAERELEALVAVSSPSGDVPGAEEAVALAVAFMPPEAEIERLPSSSAGHSEDLCGRLHGGGTGRVLLLGHLDTVFAHTDHRTIEQRGERLVGSGAVDMKGGVALALGVMRELAGRAERFAEVALLLVTDEEWRTGALQHVERFAGWDACLCFEAGERTPEGHDAVIVKRKAAGTLRVEAHGQSAHSGSSPEKGRSALLALAFAAQRVAEHGAPGAAERLTAVPTILRSGEAFNVVPAHGELLCDLRADDLAAFEPVIAALPAEREGVRLDARLVRSWPGMDSREATEGLLRAAAERLGRPIVGSERGGASDASHVAQRIPVTVDGLGPRGGGAHSPEEWVGRGTLGPRAEVALALVAALLDGV